MTKLDRRGVIRVLAAGSACAAGGVFAGESAASASTADRFDPLAPVWLGFAEVTACRSHAAEIYLTFDAQHRGFVAVDARGLAIAAACQVNGCPVAVQAWGHDREAAAGAGRFEGAFLAVHPRDLPAAAAFPAE